MADIDFSTLPDQADDSAGNSGKIDFSTLPDQAPQTVPGKAADFLNTVAKKTFLSIFPGRDTLETAKAIHGAGSVSEAVQGAYFPLMPSLEKAGADVKAAKTASILNLLTKGSYPKPVEGAANVGNFLLDLAPFEPSSFAGYLTGPVTKAFPGGMEPLTKAFPRSADTVGAGISRVAGEAAGPEITPETTGQAAQGAYESRVGAPLRQLTMPSPRAPISEPQPIPEPTGPEIFNPEYQRVSGKIGSEPVTQTQFGKNAQAFYKNTAKNLQSKESRLWNSVKSEHADKSGALKNTRAYFESVFNESGAGVSPTYLERLNPQLRLAVENEANPEEVARGIFEREYGKPGSKDVFVDPQSDPQAKGETPQLYRGMGVLQRIFEATNEKNLTFNQIKMLRTQVGQMIKSWGQRGTSFDHMLKQTYRALTEDMIASAKEGGFEKDVEAATQASRDYFRHADLPSSQIMSKTPYASDLMDKLIKTDSPERVQELFREHGLSETDKDVLRRGVLDRMNFESKGDPKKFKNLLDQWTPDTKKEFFGDKTALVDSLGDTVKTLNDAVANVKAENAKAAESVKFRNAPIPVPKAQDILSVDGYKLDKIMNGRPSELVSEILKDGSSEMARTVSGAVGKDAMPLLRRGALQEMIRGSKPTPSPSGNQINVPRLSAELQNYSPEFIKEFWGEDAQQVMALRDASKMYAEKMAVTRGTPYNPVTTVRRLNFIRNLIERYKLSSGVRQVVGKTAGSAMADKIVPPRTLGFDLFPSPYSAQSDSNENP